MSLWNSLWKQYETSTGLFGPLCDPAAAAADHSAATKPDDEARSRSPAAVPTIDKPPPGQPPKRPGLKQRMSSAVSMTFFSSSESSNVADLHVPTDSRRDEQPTYLDVSRMPQPTLGYRKYDGFPPS